MTQYDGRQRCLCMTLVIMASILGVFLIFAISFGVASGGHGCTCNDDKCCVASQHWCSDQCYCKPRRDTYVYDEDDDEIGYCEKRSTIHGAYVAFLVLTIITGITTAIIGCCMCCPCCQPSRVNVARKMVVRSVGRQRGVFCGRACYRGILDADFWKSAPVAIRLSCCSSAASTEIRFL